MRCVPAHDFTVMKAYLWRSAINEKPPYQRESSVWSLEKQQLFIDSLLNGYDVPKIYLHDLRGIAVGDGGPGASGGGPPRPPAGGRARARPP